MKPFKLSISVTPAAPHRHDAEIMRLARAIRRLIAQRKRDRISAANKGKPKSPEHIAKIRAQRFTAGPRAGYYRHSPATIEKMKAGHARRRQRKEESKCPPAIG